MLTKEEIWKAQVKEISEKNKISKAGTVKESYQKIGRQAWNLEQEFHKNLKNELRKESIFKQKSEKKNLHKERLYLQIERIL